MGRRLKVKVELFPARANLESFGLRIEKNRGEDDEEEEEVVEEEQERERKRKRAVSLKESTEMADTRVVYYSAQFWTTVVPALVILSRSFRDPSRARRRGKDTDGQG